MTYHQHQMIIDRLDRIESNLERLCPAGSTPASGCPTRGAGGEPGAVKLSDTDSPLPDQGGGERPQRSDLAEYSDWFNSDEAAKLLHPLPIKPGANEWSIIAAVFVAGRQSVRRDPLTQSVADADEPEAELHHKVKEWRLDAAKAELRADHFLKIKLPSPAAYATRKAAKLRGMADLLEALLPQVSRKERSVSGNV